MWDVGCGCGVTFERFHKLNTMQMRNAIIALVVVVVVMCVCDSRISVCRLCVDPQLHLAPFAHTLTPAHRNKLITLHSYVIES